LRERAVESTTIAAIVAHAFVHCVAPADVLSDMMLTCVGVHDRGRKWQFANLWSWPVIA